MASMREIQTTHKPVLQSTASDYKSDETGILLLSLQ